MASYNEIVTLQRNELAVVNLPLQQLTIVNHRCIGSPNDLAVIIVNKLTHKLTFGKALGCEDMILRGKPLDWNDTVS